MTGRTFVPNLTLAERMHEMGITSTGLSHQLGLSRSTISAILNGKRRPSRITAWRIAKALRTTPEELGLLNEKGVVL